MHLEIVRAAADAGKHIFCEKPVGRNPQETADIEDAARQAGVLSFVGYNYRWAPLVQYAHQLIQQGRLGKLTHYRGRFFPGYAKNPYGVLSWRFQRELAGLEPWAISCHTSWTWRISSPVLSNESSETVRHSFPNGRLQPLEKARIFPSAQMGKWVMSVTKIMLERWRSLPMEHTVA